ARRAALPRRLIRRSPSHDRTRPGRLADEPRGATGPAGRPGVAAATVARDRRTATTAARLGAATPSAAGRLGAASAPAVARQASTARPAHAAAVAAAAGRAAGAAAQR